MSHKAGVRSASISETVQRGAWRARVADIADPQRWVRARCWVVECMPSERQVVALLTRSEARQLVHELARCLPAPAVRADGSLAPTDAQILRDALSRVRRGEA